MLLLSTRTGTERAAVVLVAAIVEEAAGTGALGAVVLAGTWGAALALEVSG